MKKINIIFLIILCSCSSINNDSSQSSEVTLENSTIENNVIKDSNLDNEDSGTAGSFNLPAYNGSCIYSEEEAVNELKALQNENSLAFEINILYQTGPPECAGRSGVLVCHRVY